MREKFRNSEKFKNIYSAIHNKFFKKKQKNMVIKKIWLVKKLFFKIYVLKLKKKNMNLVFLGSRQSKPIITFIIFFGENRFIVINKLPRFQRFKNICAVNLNKNKCLKN